MRITLFLLAIVFYSCENHSFDRDQRQIIAKNEFRKMLHHNPTLDVISFNEDTLSSYPDTSFKQPIRYTINFSYKDSSGNRLSKTGEVIFTPNGNSILSSHIK